KAVSATSTAAPCLRAPGDAPGGRPAGGCRAGASPQGAVGRMAGPGGQAWLDHWTRRQTGRDGDAERGGGASRRPPPTPRPPARLPRCRRRRSAAAKQQALLGPEQLSSRGSSSSEDRGHALFALQHARLLGNPRRGRRVPRRAELRRGGRRGPRRGQRARRRAGPLAVAVRPLRVLRAGRLGMSSQGRLGEVNLTV
ncbi:unnamed protein product, partial [Prorocentrum cordatum]